MNVLLPPTLFMILDMFHERKILRQVVDYVTKRVFLERYQLIFKDINKDETSIATPTISMHRHYIYSVKLTHISPNLLQPQHTYTSEDPIKIVALSRDPGLPITPGSQRYPGSSQ